MKLRSPAEARPGAVARGRSLIGREDFCVSYEVASALVDETVNLVGGGWLSLLRH